MRTPIQKIMSQQCHVNDCNLLTFPKERFCGKHDALNDIERDMLKAKRRADRAFLLYLVAGIVFLVASVAGVAQ